MIEARAELVGSLLRPPELLEAREAAREGRLSPAELKRIEDRAVDRVVERQEEAGLRVVTDGELRRLSFQSVMTESVEGFGEVGLDAFLWGEWKGDEEVGDVRVERPDDLGPISRLRRRRSLCAEELVYLRARTERTVKVTLPSPSLFANFWSPGSSNGPYPTLDGFLEDVARILRAEVEELAALGATYLQLDAPHYTLLLDPRTRSFYESRGWSADEWLERGIELDNAVLGGLPGVTTGFHLCRGNQASRWLVEGGYDDIARPLFRRIAADRLLLEYDSPRAGTFEPLGEVPDDKTVVLGLVTTKRPEVEPADELVRRIEEASTHVPLERLAVSPQCGFSTSVAGSRLSEEDQWRKVDRVVETARRVWG